MDYGNINSLFELAERLEIDDPYGALDVHRCIIYFYPGNAKARSSVARISRDIGKGSVFHRVWLAVARQMGKLGIGNLSKNLFSRTVDLAETLENCHPFDSYLLYRVALEIGPGTHDVVAKIAKYEILFRQDLILAYRADGLCQRLIAILQGYFTAQHLGYEFQFIWPGDEHLRNVFDLEFTDGHSVRTDVYKTLAQDFAAKHLLDTKHEKVIATAMPRGSTRHRRATFRKLSQLEPERNLIRPCWVAGNLIIPELREIMETDGYRNLFKTELFTPEINEKIIEACNLELPAKRVAIHLRGGDVIYGNARKKFSAARDLTLSLAVAEELCITQLRLGYKVYVFGASQNDINYLTTKYTNVLSVRDLNLSLADDPQALIRELILMADCEKLFAGRISAVSDLASLLGRAEFITAPYILPPEEEYKVSCTCLENGSVNKFHPLQRAFIQFSAFLTAPETVDLSHMKSHILSALEDDDDRIQYWFLAYLCAHATADRSLIGISRQRLEEMIDSTIEGFFDTPHKIMCFVRLHEPAVQRVLTAAARSEFLMPNQRAFLDKLLENTT